nr:hypothetical protein [Frankia sp. QA3]
MVTSVSEARPLLMLTTTGTAERAGSGRDVLSVAGSDLRIMIYTAEPGTRDAERLALLAVLGTQALVG